MFCVVYQDNKLEEDLEEVTNKVYFDIEIDGKHIGMLYCSLCVCVRPWLCFVYMFCSVDE